MLERTDFESLRVGSPGFADELIRCEAAECFEAPGEVVGVDEVGEVASQLLMRLVEVAFDGCVLDGPVHSFDLPVGPGMLGFGQAMIDIALGAGVFEGVRPNGFSGVEGRPGVAELVLPGVVKWVPLSVRTVWTL